MGVLHIIDFLMFRKSDHREMIRQGQDGRRPRLNNGVDGGARARAKQRLGESSSCRHKAGSAVYGRASYIYIYISVWKRAAVNIETILEARITAPRSCQFCASCRMLKL